MKRCNFHLVPHFLAMFSSVYIVTYENFEQGPFFTLTIVDLNLP
jgi:hypothetical protein